MCKFASSLIKLQTYFFLIMSTLSIAIILAFVIGYLFIAIESVTKINKAAIALLMFVV